MRLTISMQKGGVGKTTTSINLSGALADRGHDVLLVDGDPQGGATLKLGHRKNYRTKSYEELYDVLADNGELALDDLSSITVAHEEFDIIPSNLRNFRLEGELYTDSRGIESLRLAMDRSNIDSMYDFILIDSPPNLGPISDGTLIASERVLFPLEPNEIAPASLEILLDEIDTLNTKYEDSYSIEFIGAVLNEVPPQGTVADEQREYFQEIFGDALFEVNDLDVIEHAIGYNTSVFGYDPDDAGYPWDDDPLERVKESYNEIADYVEGL